MGRAVRSLILIVAFWPALASAQPPADPPEPAVIAPLAVRSLLLDVKALPDGRLIAVGERGHVLTSRDAGASWVQSPAPARATLTAVYFADARRGWAVGHDEVILRTIDGGEHWFVAHFAPEREEPLLAVWFDAAGHGLAVGAYSTMYRSDDGGAGWRLVPFETQPIAAAGQAKAPARRGAPGTQGEDMRADVSAAQPHLNSIAADSRGRLYVAGEAGHLYRSDDGGQHWLELPSPYAGSFYGVLPLDGDALLAYGQRGHLFRSEDAGRSWQSLASGTQALLGGAARVAERTVVIAGLEGVVLISADGGHTFRVHQEADHKGFAAVAPVPGGVVLCGEAGVRRLTLDRLASGN